MAHSHRILLSTDILDPIDGRLSEVADTGSHLRSIFVERNVDIDLLTCGSEERVERRDGVTIFVQDRRRVAAAERALVSFRPCGQIATAIASRRYALVHTTTHGPLGDFSLEIARSSGAPFVVGYHAEDDPLLRYGIATGDVLVSSPNAPRSLFNSADLVLAPTWAKQRALAAQLKVSVAVLGRGVDHDVFSPDHRTRGYDQPVRVISTGWMTRDVELDPLLWTFSHRDDIEIVMIGDGRWRCSLESVLPRCTFIETEEMDLARTLADGDIFVLPSRAGVFDHLLLKALASGMPAVAFSGPGREELIRDGISGILVQDDADFAAAVAFLATNENARLEMGMEARREAARFRWSDVGDRLLALYAELISDRSPLVA